MKSKRKTIFIAGGTLLLVSLLLFLFFYFKEGNRITLSEKEWISDNKHSVINFAVVNDINVFGKDGEGVYFKFLNDLATEYELSINPIPYAYGNVPDGLSLSTKQSLKDTDIVVYQDHYVLVALKNEKVTSIDSLKNAKIGVLNSDINNIRNYYSELNLIGYNNSTVLIDDFRTNSDLNYLLVSANMLIDQILNNDYYIVYHFSDIPLYYTLSFVADDKLTSIITKYANTWLDEKFEKHYNEYLLKLFLNNLSIQEKDKDILTSKVYNYGSVNSTPFEVIMSGNYGGISSIYLQRFTDFSNVEFKYTNYSNTDDLRKAIDRSQIDLYFNYYNIGSKFNEISTLYNTEIAIATNKDNYLVVNSLNSVKNKTVYVEENSNVYNYLKNHEFTKLETYKNEKELKKYKRQGVIIAIENASYKYYQNNILKNYSVRYTETVNISYNYKLNGDATLNKLFTKFVAFQDPGQLKYQGLYSYSRTKANGTFIVELARYALYMIAIGLIVLYFVYKSRNKVKIGTKIRKEDKIKFIDMLTSLKNRNYLSENIPGWNKNTIYPQAAVVVDLNNVKYINDTYGTNEGDNQIKSAANILIKTQLDNSDIIRTDGNEFLIYMVGYEQKRVISYIRKLYKEFNHLPYEYGAAIGYSMRTDDLKTIDDAINEATLDMRTKKEMRE